MLSRTPRVPLITPSLHSLAPGNISIISGQTNQIYPTQIGNRFECVFWVTLNLRLFIRIVTLWNPSICNEPTLEDDIGPSNTKMSSLQNGKQLKINCNPHRDLICDQNCGQCNLFDHLCDHFCLNGEYLRIFPRFKRQFFQLQPSDSHNYSHISVLKHLVSRYDQTFFSETTLEAIEQALGAKLSRF